MLLRPSIFDPNGRPQSGAADPAAHKIYIWDISNEGQFASALDGGREPLTHLHVSIYPHLWLDELMQAFIVASQKVVYRVNYESRQHTDMALPSSRKVGRVCRRV